MSVFFLIAALGANIVQHQCRSAAPATATLFTYKDMGSYQEVHSTQCGEKYILYPRGQTKPELGSDFKYFGVPLNKVAVTQSVTHTFLEQIGVRDKIAVASEHSSTACIQKKVADGDAVAYISHSSDADAHALQMSDTSIEAIFSDPWYTSSWNHPASFSKVICEASTYELTPLGNAEWTKFFGYLFGKTTEAHEAYCGTVSRYECNSLAAVNKNVGSWEVPKVLFSSFSSYSNNFQLHMPPYKSQFVHDAGGVYPDLAAYEAFKVMHWTGTQMSRFEFPSANISLFHKALSLADVLIDETYPHMNTLKVITEKYNLPALTVGQAFLASSEDPAEGSNGWSLVSHGVAEKLFTHNQAGEIVPSLAQSIARNNDGTWTVTLAPDRFFSDGSAVTATDVAAALSRQNTMLSAARSALGTMTMDVLDALTLKISSTTSTPIMAAELNNWMFPIYKKLSTGSILFTGPYTVKSLTSSVLDLEPSTIYPNANTRIPIQVKKFSSGAAVLNALKAGEIDIGLNLPADAVAQLNWHKDLAVTSYSVEYMTMMFFNTAKLPNVNVRKALSLAIDRRALAEAALPPGISEQVIGDSVPTGPFPASTPWGSVHSQLPTDTTEAAQLLTDAGWVLGSDGFRYKNAEKLTLRLVYYTFRADLVAITPVIKTQLEALGVSVTVVIADDNDGPTAGDGFDMMLWMQHTLPTGDPHWFFDTFFRTGPAPSGWSAQNWAGISSATIDSALDVLAAAEVGPARDAAAADAHDKIVAEYAGTWLTHPTWYVGVNPRAQEYVAWGSDYYFIKSSMPGNNWPAAVKNERVYTLDGTMSQDSPTGGTDWYESRVAEPDGFLSDLIAVLHPTQANYAPSGMHYLRHAHTGTSNIVTAADCVDPSAPHPIKASSCISLSIDDPTLTPDGSDSFVTRPSPPPPPPPPSPPPPSDDDDDGKTGLFVAIGVLSGVTVITFVIMAAVWLHMQKKYAANEKASKGTAPADP